MSKTGIIFTRHARDKFEVLGRHNVVYSEQQIIDTVLQPDLIDQSRLPLLIAQKGIDQDHVLRVVYREELGVKVIITFYPGRRKQYEKNER